MAKNNNSRKVYLILALAIISAAVGYGILHNTVATNHEDIKAVETKANSNETSIVELKTDVKWIRRESTKQTAVLEEIRDKVH